ncbi:hypothetical protein I8D64_04860 [Brachybacterium sp. MASK1Z-5]|uniref:Uncharacterized protein n=1 Tax=Brachybacterium halotolerans TaxID=2795215 RepID=A0ABS1B8A4_9MICO|nr:hypothetical protein [Brachybacterium halotolerans]MBK0330727.1 hypothetical protein [Brachybacterium halotolerans]
MQTLALPAGDTKMSEVEVPADSKGPTQLKYHVEVSPAAIDSDTGVLVAARVACDTSGGADMVFDGITSTNVVLARGGSLEGEALVDATAATHCRVVVSAPLDSAAASVQPEVTVRTRLTAAASGAGVEFLDMKGSEPQLVSRNRPAYVTEGRIDQPKKGFDLTQTVRMTSCTTEGGSRDGGESRNLCTPGLVSDKPAAARVRINVVWYDAEGNEVADRTVWDEVNSIDPAVHHLPWTVNISGIQPPGDVPAASARIITRVDSTAGPPFVVHESGTGAVSSPHSSSE